jgi:spore cortex formation protein SpoVR/YcgB (stage V sporulation)
MITCRRIPENVTAVQWTEDNFAEIQDFLTQQVVQRHNTLFVFTHDGTREYIVIEGGRLSVYNPIRFRQLFELI